MELNRHYDANTKQFERPGFSGMGEPIAALALGRKHCLPHDSEVASNATERMELRTEGWSLGPRF